MSAGPAAKPDFPWWLVVASVLALAVALFVAVDDIYAVPVTTTNVSLG